MKPDVPPKQELTYIFGCKVKECSPLTKGFGLRVELEQLTDLAKTMTKPPKEKSNLAGESNRGMFELARHYGVVVVNKAVIEKPYSAKVSGKWSGFLLQDIWHWDSALRGYATILHNPKHQARLAPTL